MKRRRHKEQGVALVVTIIVVAMLAVVGVALMQSVSADRASSRSVTNYLNARLAAEAGVADAMSRMTAAMTNFNYVSGGEATGGGNYRTYVRPRKEKDGSWQFDGSAKKYLESETGGATATLLVAGTNAASGVTVNASYTNYFTNALVTNRYAFWVDEAGAKQNLSWWGGGGTRDLVTNVSDLPLVLPTANGQSVSAMPPDALIGLQNSRVYSTASTNLFGLGSVNTRTVANALLTPATFNLLSANLNGVASRYFFAMANPSTAATPLGGKRLDLQRLANYVNTLSVEQASGNARAALVDDLLKDSPDDQDQWGGGSLSWLAKSGAYTGPGTYELAATATGGAMPDQFPALRVGKRAFSNGEGSTATVTVNADGSGTLEATGLVEIDAMQGATPDPSARLDLSMQWTCQGGG